MEQQVLVADGVHAAVREQHLDMFLQFLADAERVVQTLHELMLLGGQFVGMLGVDSWEVTRAHVVRLAIDGADTTFVVDMLKQATVFHLPFRTAVVNQCFLLELNDGDGLVHLGSQAHILILHRVVLQELWLELLAGVVAIHLHCKGGQRYEVDAVSLLDGSQVGIAQAQA